MDVDEFFAEPPTGGTVALSVATAVAVYLSLSIGRVSMYSNNPGVLGAAAILAACVVVGVSLLGRRRDQVTT